MVFCMVEFVVHLLIFLYINYITVNTKHLLCTIFADDTSIFYGNNNLNNLRNIIISELTSLNSWCKSNKLSLNIRKPTFILFELYHRLVSVDDLKHHINNNPVMQVTNVKFLGIYCNCNENLSWKFINYIEFILSRNIGIINKILHLLESMLMTILYITLSLHIFWLYLMSQYLFH